MKLISLVSQNSETNILKLEQDIGRSPQVAITDARYNFSKNQETHSCHNLCQLLKLKQIFLFDQVHGTEIVKAEHLPDNTQRFKADGFFFAREFLSLGSVFSDYAFGIKAADCMPIALWGSKGACLVHAGWRGLAAGIVEKAAAMVVDSNGSLGTLSVFVGPCAGEASYEVGAEVLEALRPNVHYQETGAQRFNLSLARSVELRLHALYGLRVEVFATKHDTISEKQFHSYRRDGEKAGRNLMFFAFPAKSVA